MKHALLGTLLTLSSMSHVKAEIVQFNDDQLIKESDEIARCRGLDLSANGSAPLVAPAPAPVVKAPVVAAPISVPVKEVAIVTSAQELEKPVTVEEIEMPLKDLSPTEKLKDYRTRLEEKNLLLLERKMELVRLEQELNLLKNLERSMNQTLNAIKSVE